MSGVFVARESRTRKAKSLTHIVLHDLHVVMRFARNRPVSKLFSLFDQLGKATIPLLNSQQ